MTAALKLLEVKKTSASRYWRGLLLVFLQDFLNLRRCLVLNTGNVAVAYHFELAYETSEVESVSGLSRSHLHQVI